MPEQDALISRYRVRPVMAPLAKPHKTASGTIDAAPLVLIDIFTDDGIAGTTYLFSYTPAALKPLANLTENILADLVGETSNPDSVFKLLDARFRLLGNQGLVAMVISGIDMALWDAVAKREGKPLGALLDQGTEPVRVYDSLGQMSPEETAREVELSLGRGFRAFKIKAGHSDPARDIAVVRSIRDVAGPDVWVAVDFNQAFGVNEAVRRVRMLDEENIAWIEEPVHATDYLGHASVRAKIQTPVQTGENWWGLADMKKSLAAGASDYAMLDVMKIGGVTGWRRAAHLADSHSLPVASHLFVEISSHLLSATPTSMILEWFDIAGSVVSSTPEIKDGFILPTSEPGAGIVWDERAIERISG